MAPNENALADIPLFALLDAEERRELAAHLTEHDVKKGDFVFSQGDPGDCLYVVRSGEIEIFSQTPTGEKIVLDVADAGDVFGELAIFDAGPRSASAIVTEDAAMVALDRGALQMFLRKQPDAALDLLAVMARRLRQTNELVRGRVARNANAEIEGEMSWVQRLANFIAEFSGSMTFLFLNAGFFLVWIVSNIGLIPGFEPFDPFPFGLLTMAVSLEAIFLSIFVLLSQNLQAAKDRIRGDIEYEVNLKAELEVAHLHEKVESMSARILERLHRLERGLGGSGHRPVG